MKLKTIMPVILCILIGFFMSNFMFNQYDKTMETFQEKTKAYFLQIGVYSSLDNMKENLKDVNTYIYEEASGLYYAYVGITKNEENLTKIEGYFNEKQYVIYRKEKNLTSSSFIELLNQYDTMLKSTTDSLTIGKIEEEVISKYEELVINAQN
jgi:hypothetical protein